MPLYYRHKQDVIAILVLAGIILVVIAIGIIIVKLLGY